jgi:penicillin-binding protein 1A
MPQLPNIPRHLLPARLKRVFTKKRVLIAGGLFAAFLLITPMVTYAYFARDIADRERLMNRNNTGLVIEDKNGEVFYEYGKTSANDNVPLSQISDIFEKAVIASEDREFYKHQGYSLKGIMSAVYANITNKTATKYGGSTITQQLVKNKLLTTDKNFLRKYQEVSMAVAVEQKYTKQEILSMYLNSVYFGEGAFGISDAAKTYFNKKPADLTLAESTMLVGLLPAPNAYSPISGDAELGKERQAYVLDQMVDLKYISVPEKAKALDTKLAYTHAESSNFIHAQHYALMVIDELNEKYGAERVSRSGFEVKTGLDLKWQKQAEEIVKKRVASFESRGGSNAGLVAIDPKSGQVRALVGSVDWNNEQYGKVNMALAARQPGSSFKPIYYTDAFDKKIITPATIIEDQKTTFGDWTPENYDFKYRGKITVRDALAQSLNIPAAKVMQKLGVDEATAAAKRMGITTVTEPEKYGLTLALGTAETKLYEMTNAYAALANHGVQHKPVLVTNIKDKYGKTIFEHKDGEAEQVVSEQAAFLTSSILADNTARAPTFGSSLNFRGRQVAVKTGTTNDNKDAWTIGYTPSIAIGVWVGNNANQPMRGLAGGSSAGMIWKDTMISFVKDTASEKFTPPAGIIKVRICNGTSQPLKAPEDYSSAYTEFFIKGTEPTGECKQKIRKPSTTTQKEDKKENKKENKKDEKPKDEENNGGGRGGDTEPTEPTPDEPPTEPGPDNPPTEPTPDDPPTEPTEPPPPTTEPTTP